MSQCVGPCLSYATQAVQVNVVDCNQVQCYHFELKFEGPQSSAVQLISEAQAKIANRSQQSFDIELASIQFRCCCAIHLSLIQITATLCKGDTAIFGPFGVETEPHLPSQSECLSTYVVLAKLQVDLDPTTNTSRCLVFSQPPLAPRNESPSINTRKRSRSPGFDQPIAKIPRAAC
eukprot:c5337_g1_i1.p1 GENE.c5337_g1_i1~~c5337_g1_i1.p1  ORF type:complete len:176 (+),score=27.60 c5337_g1_i1:38-565(+)